MMFCLLTTVVLYLIACRVFEKRYLALLTAAFWALGVGAMSSAVFIRMYAMLTFFCVLLVFLHLKAEERIRAGGANAKLYILLWLITSLGILTQYYYLVFCFFLCGCFCVYLVIRRFLKELWKYIAAEIGAVLTAMIVFPSMLEHIFQGYRGKEAIENLSHTSGFTAVLRKVFSVIGARLLNGWLAELLVLILAAAVIHCIFKLLRRVSLRYEGDGDHIEVHVHRKPRGDEAVLLISRASVVFAVLSIVALGYTVLIAKIAPSQTDRYYMCIFPFVSLIAVYLVRRAIALFVSRKRIADTAVIVLFAVCAVASYQMQSVNYLYLDYRSRDVLEEYRDYPVIVINGETYNRFADRYLDEYQCYPAVYQCSCNGDLSSLAHAVEGRDLSDGFLLYAVGYSPDEEEYLFSQMSDTIDIASHEGLVTAGFPVFFCTLGQ